MNRDELLRLDRIAARRPQDLTDESDVAVLTELRATQKEMVADALREQLEQTGSPALRNAAREIDLTAADDPGQALLNGLREAKASDSVVQQAKAQIEKVRSVARVLDDLPVGANPLLRDEVAAARTHTLAQLASLETGAATKLVDGGLRISQLDDTQLDALVEHGQISAAEATSVGLATSIYRLVDEDQTLASAVLTSTPLKLEDGIGGVQKLAGLDAGAWTEVVKTSGITPPGEMTAEQYGLLLAKRVEVAFPTASLRARLATPQSPAVASAVREAEPALRQGSEVLTTGTVDLEQIDPTARDTVVRSLESLSTVVGSYAGLGLENILTDTTLPADERAQHVTKRVDQLDRFLAANAQSELVHRDLSADSEDLRELDFVGANDEERSGLLAHAKVMQRTYAVTEDAGDAARLMRAGYGSAAALATAKLVDVVRRSGLSEAVAARYHEDATVTLGTSSAMVTSMLDVVKGGFGRLKVANLAPSIEDFFKKLDGYEDLFGSQDYCACEHCKSILGPAAYFVDLMHFIEEHLLGPVFGGAKQNHVLNLRTRRPDLWTLPLTCDNTNTELPQLVIVNEILENYLAKRTGFAGDLTDRTAVEHAVYRQKLASSTACFALPYTDPITRIETYLQHFAVPRSRIVALAGGSADQRTAAELGLSLLEHTLISQPNEAPAFLNQVYAQTFTFQAAGAAPFDAQDLLRPMGVTREELTDLVSARYVSAGGAQAVTIKGEKRSAASVQNDIERVHGLRPASLDRMHRFVRLWRACDGWTIRELDLTIEQLAQAGLSSGIEPATLSGIARLRALQRRYPMALEDLTVLFGTVPTRTLVDGKPSLFDRLFNLPELVRLDGALPKPAERFVHPALRDDTAVAPTDHLLHRLLAALRTDAAGLAALVDHLAEPLGADPDAAAETDRGFLLTHQNLTLLLRHARLARMLKLGVPELFRLLALLPGGRTHVSDLDDLEALLDAAAWTKRAKRSVDDLAYVVGAPVEGAAGYPQAASLAQRVVDRLAADRSLTFTDTVFTLVPGVTEAQSRELVAANAAAFSVAGAQLRLADTFEPSAALSVPASVTAAEADLRAVLLPHHAGTLLRSALASQLKISVEKLSALLALATADLDAASIAPEARKDAAPTTLTAAIEQVLALTVLFAPKDLSAAVIDFAAARRDLFALGDLAALTSEAVRKVEQFRRHAGSDPDGAAFVVQALTGYTAAAHFTGSDQDALAAVLDIDRPVAGSLQANLELPADALDALDVLADAAAITRTIGIGGEAFALVASDDYAELDQGADAVFAAFRAKYASEEAWEEAFEPFRSRILGARRDALAAYLVYAVHPEFERVEDLYRYFLLDVEVEGCFTTSRLVAAISSAQLYVHRVLMNLEQDAAGNVHVQPSRVPRDEWEWRKNYRVWEANRKVFLWPENYLFPDLRDDKTPLFEDLEQELLQTDIDEQAVLDAYGTYLDGFSELAGLTIAGAYQEVDHRSDADVLHLFGVTPGDPATFYYRRVENAAPQGRRAGGTVWGPWRKVDVAIPVREVAPIVFNGRLHLLWAEIVTAPTNQLTDEGSRFAGYNHKMSLKFTTLRLDERWTPPQKVRLYGTDPFGESDGVIEDPLAEPEEWSDFASAIGGILGWGIFGDASAAGDLDDALKRLITPRYDDEVHVKARDGYTLRGLEWEGLYPEAHGDSLFLAGAGYQLRSYVDTFDKTTASAPSFRLGRLAATLNFSPHTPLLTKKNGRLYYGTPTFSVFDDHAYAALAADRVRLDRVLKEWSTSTKNLVTANLYVGQLATIGSARVSPINGSLSDGIIDSNGDLYLMQATPAAAATWALRRLGTTLAKKVARELFTHGIEHLLDLNTQRSLAEAPLAFSLSGSRVVNRVNAGRLDLTGPFGTYYREIFFHIPFLIANHLNGQGKYAEAERWYHHIFDPTSSEVIPPDPALSAAANEARQRDRNWRYLEFRGLSVPTLRQVLTDTSAIAAYHKDPFNPHAIARLRLSAYQKAIVMRYADNKLDLADALFERFERESVNEALIHYATVSDILGDRPARLGSCGEGAVDPRTYEKIKPLIDKGSEFLIEVENLLIVKHPPVPVKRPKYLWEVTQVRGLTKSALKSPAVKEAGVFGLQEAAGIVPERVRAAYAARNLPAVKVKPAVDPGDEPRIRAAVIRGATVAERGRGPVIRPIPEPGGGRPGGGRPGGEPGEDPGGGRPGGGRPIEDPGGGRPGGGRPGEDPGGGRPGGGRPDPDPHPGERPVTPAALFAARSALPDNVADAVEAAGGLREHVTTSDLHQPVGLSAMGRPGPDDLNTESLKALADQRVEVTKAFDRSIATVEALPPLVGVSAERMKERDRTGGADDLTAGPDWKRLSAYEGRNRLRPKAIDRADLRYRDKRMPGRFGISVIRQVNPVFCVPPNKDLLAYWDRLEDRLWKLRNCRDITGALRRLSLFSPEIDPMALVRARAGGVSLEDALNSLGGEVPPYRFAYLLERAKSQAGAVQGFGNALQSALERRDGEQLNLLRAQHQKQILELTTKARLQERDAAANAVAVLERHRQTVENRKSYFVGLVDGSLSAEEQVQRISKHIANAAKLTEAGLGFLAGALHLIPQLGSPFAMKYGGVETGWSAKSFAVGVRATGEFADALSSSAALEAGFNRREQGWEQQVAAADDELAEIDVQLTGARLRRDVAEQGMKIHDRSLEQADEVLELYQDHFTDVGLYTYLSTVLQRLYREAFNTALAMARMAEQAYRFERGDNTLVLSGAYWDAEHAGLSAGAQLLIDLQRLERRYVETNTRDLEIDQSFSLTQIAPAALVQLRQTGECEFTVPEVFFDLAYPGHFRRRLKSARLTIPCVTGPYANVSATLELLESRMRPEPRHGAANLVEVPNARATAIATSTGQSDPGVFELNFRDERYMPFEGAGAVSTWRLSMPKSFRQFDYSTINDVVLRLAYTARSDGAFRDATEAQNAAVEGTILNALSNAPLPRVVSLRNEFSNTFNRLLHSPAGTDAKLTLTAAHLPFFLVGRDVTVSSAKLALRNRTAGGLGALAFEVNGQATGPFAADPSVGDLPAVEVTAAFAADLLAEHRITVTNAGGLAPDSPVPGDPSALDQSRLLDVFLILELTVG